MRAEPVNVTSTAFKKALINRALGAELSHQLRNGFGALLIGLGSATPMPVWLLQAVIVGLAALLGFGLAEQWPARLPAWLPRWVLQLTVMVIAVPLGARLAYWVTTGGSPQFGQNPARLIGFGQLTFAGVVFGLWLALGALVRQREALARQQALAFELERSELARQALDARMGLLQAQVQSHFLSNTLANVQALVDARSPQASTVLGSLIAYLRAAVPRLNETDTTFERELQLVRAYLELMHLRMPDRLRFSVNADAAALGLRCPPMTLQTLVENAVQHRIDPFGEGDGSTLRYRSSTGAAASGSVTPGSGCTTRARASALVCRRCANACNSPSEAMRTCA